VPIVRRERAVGVLCVQHVEPRRYEEVEIEALQTTAMVLSELIPTPAWSTRRGAGASPPRSPGRQTLPGSRWSRAWRGAGGLPPAARHHRADRGRGYRGRAPAVYLAFDKMREQIDT
jgi:phosphotransferase system, enzyme I, PtsP